MSLRDGHVALLRARGLEAPTGEALYTYKITREELGHVRETLRRSRGLFLVDRWGCSLFLIFAAEWFRRDREGGHWAWARLLAEVGVRYDTSAHREIREAVESGLAAWRRPAPSGAMGTRRFINSVIRESGFPVAAIRQHAGLATWLKRSVLDIEAGFAGEDAVARQAWRAPGDLAPVLLDPAVALCEAVFALRKLLPVGSSDDAAEVLDRVRPGWRDELPFLVEDEDSKRLVEDLVRARTSEGRGLRVTRRLRRSGDGWVAHAELELEGAIEHRRLPAHLRGLLDGADRVRVRPGGLLADLGRGLAALERDRRDDDDRWEVRRLVQRFDPISPLDDEVRLDVMAGSEPLAEMTAFGGEPMLGPVVALQSSAEIELARAGDVRELEVLGASPARSRRPWLVLAVEDEARPGLGFEHEADVVDLGLLAASDRRLLAFHGRAVLELDGARLVWRSGDQSEQALRLVLTGDPVGDVREHVFRGCPEVWEIDGDHGRLISKRDLLWRAIGSREWRRGSAHPPLGRVELALHRDDELVAWSRAAIAPKGFAATADPRASTLRLTGLKGGSVAVSSCGRVLPTRPEDDALVVDLAGHPRGVCLRLVARWAGSADVEMTLPDPLTAPVLLNPEGRPIVRAHLSIGRMRGHQLLAPQGAALLLELRSRDRWPVHARHVVRGVRPLAALEDVVREMLGGCEGREAQDAVVRLSWLGSSEWTVEVGWHDHSRPLERTDEDGDDPGLSLDAFSLAEPGNGIDHPPLATRHEMRAWLEERLGGGPWLLSGTTADGRRLRPRVLAPADPLDGGLGRLQMAGQAAFQAERDAAFDVCLAEPEKLTPGELRHLVELCLTASKADVPYASLDALRALRRAPSTAAFVLAECRDLEEREAVLRLQTELPMLWCATPIASWSAAFGALRARLVAKLEAIGEPSRLADRRIVDALGEIVAREPSLQVHALCVMLSGQAHEAATLQRFLRAPSSGIRELAQDLVRRHGDGVDPPRDLRTATALPARADLWTRFPFQDLYADAIAAPLVASRIAMGELDGRDWLRACREAWLYDRDYFESALVLELLEAARQPRGTAG